MRASGDWQSLSSWTPNPLLLCVPQGLVDPRVRACAATGARRRRHIGPPSRTTNTTAAAAAVAASTLRTRRRAFWRTLRRTWCRTWPSGPGRRVPSSRRHHRRRRRLCAARAEMAAQLGSSVAFGAGCGQALPGMPRKRLYVYSSPVCRLGGDGLNRCSRSILRRSASPVRWSWRPHSRRRRGRLRNSSVASRMTLLLLFLLVPPLFFLPFRLSFLLLLPPLLPLPPRPKQFCASVPRGPEVQRVGWCVPCEARLYLLSRH